MSSEDSCEDEYDDENVRQVDTTTVQNAEAYVLFYRFVVFFILLKN